MYEKPTVTELGSLADMTRVWVKQLGNNDDQGFIVEGQTIGS